MTTRSIVKGHGSIRHNNRSLQHRQDSTWDPGLSSRNVIYADNDPRKIYQELFGASYAAWQQKQRDTGHKKVADQYASYYDKIKHSKQEKLTYEFVVCIGSVEDKKDKRTHDRILAALDEYNRSFQQQNPNFRVVQQITHKDEAGIEHTHIQFVPFVTGCKRGLSTKNSMTGALQAMGFSGKDNFAAWRQAEEARLDKIMVKHDLTPERAEISRNEHLSIKDFKNLKAEENQLDAGRPKRTILGPSKEIMEVNTTDYKKLLKTAKKGLLVDAKAKELNMREAAVASREEAVARKSEEVDRDYWKYKNKYQELSDKELELVDREASVSCSENQQHKASVYEKLVDAVADLVENHPDVRKMAEKVWYWTEEKHPAAGEFFEDVQKNLNARARKREQLNEWAKEITGEDQGIFGDDHGISGRSL